MPSSNHTDVDSDYAVSNPPPSSTSSSLSETVLGDVWTFLLKLFGL